MKFCVYVHVFWLYVKWYWWFDCCLACFHDVMLNMVVIVGQKMAGLALSCLWKIMCCWTVLGCISSVYLWLSLTRIIIFHISKKSLAHDVVHLMFYLLMYAWFWFWAFFFKGHIALVGWKWYHLVFLGIVYGFVIHKTNIIVPPWEFSPHSLMVRYFIRLPEVFI